MKRILSFAGLDSSSPHRSSDEINRYVYAIAIASDKKNVSQGGGQ